MRKKWKEHLDRTFNPTKSFKEKVKLICTKKFSMREIVDRIELFILLTQLLRYLISGRSHVEYLHNYVHNPLHKIVFPRNWRTNFRDKSFMMRLSLNRRHDRRHLGGMRKIYHLLKMMKQWRMILEGIIWRGKIMICRNNEWYPGNSFVTLLSLVTFERHIILKCCLSTTVLNFDPVTPTIKTVRVYDAHQIMYDNCWTDSYYFQII